MRRTMMRGAHPSAIFGVESLSQIAAKEKSFRGIGAHALSTLSRVGPTWIATLQKTRNAELVTQATRRVTNSLLHQPTHPDVRPCRPSCKQTCTRAACHKIHRLVSHATHHTFRCPSFPFEGTESVDTTPSSPADNAVSAAPAMCTAAGALHRES